MPSVCHFEHMQALTVPCAACIISKICADGGAQAGAAISTLSKLSALQLA